MAVTGGREVRHVGALHHGGTEDTEKIRSSSPIHGIRVQSHVRKRRSAAEGFLVDTVRGEIP